MNSPGSIKQLRLEEALVCSGIPIVEACFPIPPCAGGACDGQREKPGEAGDREATFHQI